MHTTANHRILRREYNARTIKNSLQVSSECNSYQSMNLIRNFPIFLRPIQIHALFR